MMTGQLVRLRAPFSIRSSSDNVRYPLVTSESDRVWLKYCGFLDLDLQQFMAIQESLLLQQLEKVAYSSLGKKLIGDRTPASVEEYRRLVQLTDYEDYLPELNSGSDTALLEKYHIWASMSDAVDDSRRVPYTLEAYHRALDNLMAVFILACSQQRGRSSLIAGDRVLINVAPPPQLSGILASGASQVFNLRTVLPPDIHNSMDFLEKTNKGFEMSLQTGMDIIIAMSGVLVEMGNEFDRLFKRRSLSRHLIHPGEFMRVTRAFLRSKLESRKIVLRDLWPVKALISWGIDAGIYRDLVYKSWGAYPYEFHACPEAGIIAVQSWTRRGMTFLPHASFYEFIPEFEWLKSRKDIFYKPQTVLLSEVKPGERYELVISSFYGMPFIRYRLGHLVRITALEDADAEIYLPQMVFEAIEDHQIDITGLLKPGGKPELPLDDGDVFPREPTTYLGSQA